MGKLALNTSEIKKQRDALKMYSKFLPSLDLKRRQLLTEQKGANQELNQLEQQLSEATAKASDLFPLLGGSEVLVDGLVRVKQVEIRKENVLGSKLPRLLKIEFEVAEYSTMAKPFWVDFLVDAIQTVAELQIRYSVQRQRVMRLVEAVRRITQRVNLFEKVLIPNAKKNIQRIQIYLSDTERAAVVRSKIAKKKHGNLFDAPDDMAPF